jgi:hypothetical protein
VVLEFPACEDPIDSVDQRNAGVDKIEDDAVK